MMNGMRELQMGKVVAGINELFLPQRCMPESKLSLKLTQTIQNYRPLEHFSVQVFMDAFSDSSQRLFH